MATPKVMLPAFRVSLDFLGKDWSECYILMRDLPWARTKAIRSSVAAANDEESNTIFVSAIQEAFVGGRVLDTNGEPTELTAAMITAENFSFEILGMLYRYAVGAELPKASMRPGASSTGAALPPTN